MSTSFAFTKHGGRGRNRRGFGLVCYRSASYRKNRANRGLSRSRRSVATSCAAKAPYCCCEIETRRKLRVTGAQHNQSRPAAKKTMAYCGPTQLRSQAARANRSNHPPLRVVILVTSFDPSPTPKKKIPSSKYTARTATGGAGASSGGARPRRLKVGGGRRRRVVRRPAERL